MKHNVLGSWLVADVCVCVLITVYLLRVCVQAKVPV